MQYMSTIPGPDPDTKTPRFKLPDIIATRIATSSVPRPFYPETIVQAGA
ncbi:MAG: hypothetical protein QOG66_2305 [Methylobacteriaceae bacterium]|jgi:hypothetical protein|nr:hypothetical protein [Methylobacteriaceae bacterium]